MPVLDILVFLIVSAIDLNYLKFFFLVLFFSNSILS